MKSIVKIPLLATTTLLSTIPVEFSDPDRTYFELLDGYGYPYEIAPTYIPIRVVNPRDGYYIVIEQRHYYNGEHKTTTIYINGNGTGEQIIDGLLSYDIALGSPNGANIEFEFKLYNPNNTCLLNYYYHMVRPSQKTIKSSEYVGQTYHIDGYTFTIKDYDLITYEEVDFKNSSFTYYIDEDRSLNISEISLNYKSAYTLHNLDDNNYLFIYDPDKHFSNFRNYYGFIRIPIYAYQSQDKKHINVGMKIMYYDPVTLDMSEKQLSGYEPTDKFYVKRGDEEYFASSHNHLTLYWILLSRIAIDINTLHFETFEENFVGLCGSSTYCISGGIKE